MAEWIIEHSGDVSAPTALGWTSLHTAAQVAARDRQKQIAMIKMLLARGADPTAMTSLSQTPLDVATQRVNYMAASVLEKAQLAHQLIQAGGEAKSPDSVTVRFGGPPRAGKTTLTQALRVARFRSYFATKGNWTKKQPTWSSGPKASTARRLPVTSLLTSPFLTWEVMPSSFCNSPNVHRRRISASH